MNVVVVMIDTLRYDWLGCNGNPWVKTPNLDRFARQAVIFDRAYCGSWATIPQRTDAFTGRFGKPLHHWAPLSWSQVTLPEVMRDAGYASMLINDTPHMINHGYGFERPFNAFDFVRGAEVDRWRTDPIKLEDLHCDPKHIRLAETFGAQAYRNTLSFHKETDHNTPRLFLAAAEWLERNRSRDKFFLWVDCFSPHEPFNPPQHYVDLYDPGYEGDVLSFVHYGPLTGHSPAAIKHMRALYAGLITLVDRWLGFFLDELDLLGLSASTAVVITADHGTSAGDRNMAGKQPPLYEEIAHVPFMVRLPGGGESGRLDNLTQPADLMPTILELTGLTAPEGTNMQGVSLAPLLRGGTMKTREIAVTGNLELLTMPGQAQVTVTSDRWTLIDSPEPQKRQLFDLHNDPGQENDVVKQHPKVVLELHDAFVEFLGAHEASESMIDFWCGDASAATRAAELIMTDPVIRAAYEARKRGMGVSAGTYLKMPELGDHSKKV